MYVCIYIYMFIYIYIFMFIYDLSCCPSFVFMFSTLLYFLNLVEQPYSINSFFVTFYLSTLFTCHILISEYSERSTTT